MHLYFIRHAQSLNNALWIETGSGLGRDPDPELSDIGHLQKRYLAKFLHNGSNVISSPGRDPHNIIGFNITHIYCSLMVRAIQTGLAAAEELGLPLFAWRDLHETGGIVSGDGMETPYVGLPGKPRSFFENNYPDVHLMDDFGEDGWWNRPYEEHAEILIRAHRVLEKLQELHGSSDDRVAIITHGAFYNYMMQILLDMEDQQLWLSISNTAITRWDFRRDSRDVEKMVRILDYTNRIDFLPPDLVTP